MRPIQILAGTFTSIALLSLIGWPGETISTAADPAGPWNPPGRGTPSIDILGSAPSYSDLYGDVAVTTRYPEQVLAAVRLADGGTSWTYERRWGDDRLDPIRVDDRHIAVAWRDGRVTLIDVPTGRIVWQTDMPDGPHARANRAYDEEWGAAWELSVARRGATPTLVILHEGRIDALDARTGAISWSYQSTPCGFIDTVRSAGGAVLITHSCKDQTRSGVALSAEDGRPLWRFTDEESYNVRGLGEDRMVAIAGDGELTVRRTADGKILWRDRPAGLKDNLSVDSLGVSADLLTVRTNTAVVAYRIADGGIAWRRTIGDWRVKFGGEGAVLTNGLVTYAAREAKTLVKLDARTGLVIDERQLDDEITLEWMRGDLAVITVGIYQEQVIS